jgi:hypothetical protein
MVTAPPEPREADMDENIGGAGPAIAAHSKDGSAAGQTAASGVTGQPNQGEPSEEYLGRLATQLGDLVRQEPLIAAAVTGLVGLCVGMMLGRRRDVRAR